MGEPVGENGRGPGVEVKCWFEVLIDGEVVMVVVAGWFEVLIDGEIVVVAEVVMVVVVALIIAGIFLQLALTMFSIAPMLHAGYSHIPHTCTV